MSSTKIINVLKDDSFPEILDLFKATPAEEVIFVLPKRSKAFQKEDHFAALKTEAKSLGKSVSFLCSNPDLNEFAKKYHFDVLLARAPVQRKVASKPANSINVVNQIEEFYSEPALDKDMISIAPVVALEEPEPTRVSRRLDEVVTTDDRQNVKVSGYKEKAVPVAVRQNEFTEDLDDHSARDEIKGMWAEQAVVPAVKKFSPTKSPSWAKKFTFNSSGHRRGLIALACVAILVLGTVIFITTGKAQVTLKPADQPLDLSLAVIASDNIPSVDAVNMAIPGQVFNIQKTVSQDFPATGHVDVAQKARGTITAYNELNSSQPLVATTRFESADQHIFHTLTSISIPAAKTVNGKLVPGSIDVQVIADKPGADYNVPVGLFTIPAFKEKGDTVKYQKVYGQSTAPMLSGTSGQASVATESDLSAAKQTLTQMLTTSIQSELNAEVSDLKIINDNQINIGNPTATNPTNGASATFTSNLSGTIKTVGFKETDLGALISQYVDTHNNKKVLPEKLKLTYDNIHWDNAKAGLAFTVHVTGPSYAKIDQGQIITDLLGKNDAQIKAYLGGISGIAEAHVSLSPFWVRSIPKDPQKVTVDLSY